MSERRIRLNDIAEQAGTSVTTVSHALRGTRYVSEYLREQIDSAMKELGVTSADFASRTRNQGGRFNGLLIDSPDEPFLRFLIKGVLGVNAVQINFTDADPFKSDLALQSMIEARAPGVIIAPRGHFPFVSRIRPQLQISGMHAVFVGRDEPTIPSDFPHDGKVYADNASAVRESVGRLAAIGHSRFALMTQRPNQTLLAGFRTGLEEASLPLLRDLLVIGSSIEDGRALARHFLGMDNPPTAIIAGGYNLTVGALVALQEKGLHFPEDIAFVGSDYPYPYGEAGRDHMMVIKRPGELIGRATAELLMKSIEGDKITHRVIPISSELGGVDIN